MTSQPQPCAPQRPLWRAVTTVFAATAFVACGSDDDAAPATTDAATTVPATSPPATSAVPTTAVAITDAPTSAAPDTTDAPTTEAPATDAPTTEPATSLPAPTTSGEPVTDGLDPSCVERLAPASTPVAGDDATGAAFGPLAVEPAIEIQLPAARSPEDPVQESPWAFVEPIDGGFLVTVRSSSFGYFPESMLAAVHLDGGVRWVRCVPEAIARVDAAPGAAVALFRTSDQRGEGTWQQVALDTGDIAPADILADARWSPFPFAVSDTSLLFEAAEGTGTIDPDDRLLLVDLVDGSETEIEFPAGTAGLEMVVLSFGATESGDLVVEDTSGGGPAAVAILRDGAWMTDADTIADEVGARVRYVFSGSGPAPHLTAFDPSGDVAWTAPDITPFVGESGFTTAPSRDVVVVTGCWEPVQDGEMCNQHEVGGVDVATGEVLWRLPGNRGVGPVGDGHSLVTDGEELGQWLMIDTASGEIIPGQAWDDQTLFSTGCCGDEHNATERHGGVVVAIHDRLVSVFLPEGESNRTVVVALP